MQTDQNQNVSKPISVDEFNKQVRDWTFRTRGKVQRRLRGSLNYDNSGKSIQSVRASLKSEYGEIFSTGFKFNRHLVYIHYGVGRGYVRQAGTVIRGYRSDKFRQYRGRPAKTWTDPYMNPRPVKRHPHDWLDAEINAGVDDLAQIAADYHGDKAALSILDQKSKILIDKSNG